MTGHGAAAGVTGAGGRQRPEAGAMGAMGALRGFLRAEQGAMTIEFTTLVPFFIMLLVFFADATIIYLTHSEMFNVARDISRRMTTGELQNDTDVEAYAADNLFLGTRTYYVFTDHSGDKTVSLAISLYDATIFGFFFQPILGRELVATATMGEEPRIE